MGESSRPFYSASSRIRLLYRNIKSSTESGSKFVRRSFIVKPAVENVLSDGALEAGIE